VSLWLKGREELGDALYPLSPRRILWLSLTRFFAPDCFFARRVFANSRLRGIMVSAIIWSVVALALGVGVSALTFVSGIELGETLDRFLDGFPTVSREQAEAFLEEAMHAVKVEALDARAA